jgi:phosphoglycolate phosphatase
MKKLILFDFDGTLANSFDLLIEIYNQRAGFLFAKKIDESGFDLLREYKVNEFLKYHNLHFWNIPFLIQYIRSNFEKRCLEIDFYEQIKQLIRFLSTQSELKLGILSSNTQSLLDTFLKNEEVENDFYFVIGTNLMSKRKYLEDIFVNYNISKDEVIYVSDEKRDVDLCHELGIEVVAVTWGLNTFEFLVDTKPTYIARSVDELLEYLKRVTSS